MMLFIASLSFANTISNEMDIEATELETKEVSIDSNSTNSLVVENVEDWEICVTTVMAVNIQYEELAMGWWEITYEIWTWTNCYQM